MGAVIDERDALAGKIAAAGVPCTTDPRTVPPCVLLGPPRFVSPAGVGGWTVGFPIHVIAAPPGNDDATRWTTNTAEQIVRSIGWAQFEPGTYGDKDCPAHSATYTRDVANPDC